MKSLSSKMEKRRDKIQRAIFKLEGQQFGNIPPRICWPLFREESYQACKRYAILYEMFAHTKKMERKAYELEDRLSEWGIYFD